MSRVRPRPFLVFALIYAAFVSLGLPDGVLGAAWPQMRVHFGVALNENWPMLALGTCGAVLSSFFSGVVLRALGVGRVLLFTTLLTAIVLLAYAASPAFTWIITLTFFLGLGNGAVDAGLNGFVASRFSSRHMNWLHAFWGVGASLGTLIVSSVLGLNGTWRAGYVVVGLLQLSLALAFAWGRDALATEPSSTRSNRAAPRTSPSNSNADAGSESPTVTATLALPAARVSLVLFFVYCGLESGTGLWIASALHDGRGWTLQSAGLMATLYWSSLTVGRFLTGTVSTRTTPIRIVRAAVVGGLAGTTLFAVSSVIPPQTAWSGVVTAFGLLQTGFSLSPIYPMLTHDTPRSVGQAHALNLIGLQTGSGNLGYTILPILLGTLMRIYSTEWLGSLVAGLAVVMVLLVRVREGRIG